MILFATQNFLPDVGGIQTYMTGLADALVRRGHRVAVFCDSTMHGDRAFDSARPYEIRRFGGPRPLRRWRKARAIAQRLQMGDIETVICDSWKSLECLPARDIAASRVVCLAHGAEFLVAPASQKGQRIRISLDKADVIAANSRFTADLAAPFAGGNTDLRVVWPGIEPPPGASRQCVAPPASGGKTLLTIARLDPYKGVDTIIRVLPLLQRDYPEIAYHVVGEGQDRARLARLVRSMGLESAVRLHGQVSETRKAELLRECHGFVLPNRREPGEVEGFGIVLLEAAAFGRPCIAGKEGGAGDAVIAGRTGLLVDGSDSSAVEAALRTILTDTELAAAMGRAAHERFWSQFAWDSAIARFEDLVRTEPASTAPAAPSHAD